MVLGRDCGPISPIFEDLKKIVGRNYENPTSRDCFMRTPIVLIVLVLASENGAILVGVPMISTGELVTYQLRITSGSRASVLHQMRADSQEFGTSVGWVWHCGRIKRCFCSQSLMFHCKEEAVSP